MGQSVLVLLPSSMSKFLTCWQGPFQVVCQVGLVDCEVLRPGHRREEQIFHDNLLKLWWELEGILATPLPGKEKSGRELDDTLEGVMERGEVSMGQNLTENQQGKLAQIVQDFADVFSDIPGRAKGAVHKIVTHEGAIMR